MRALATTISQSLFLLLLLLCTGIIHGWPVVEVESREFKIMLDASAYHHHVVGNDDNGIHLEKPPCEERPLALQQLEQDLRDASPLPDVTMVRGNLTLSTAKSAMPRRVRFYDTPGDCRLRKNDLVLRAREEKPKTTTGNNASSSSWRGTLKVRHGDRYYASYRRAHMNQCRQTETDDGGKFEEDVTLDWRSQFSYSHNCWLPPKSHDGEPQQQGEQGATAETEEKPEEHAATNPSTVARFYPRDNTPLDSSHAFQTLQDVVDTWGGTTSQLFLNEFQLELDAPLRLVSDLEVTECVYQGLVVDFVASDNNKADDDEQGAVSVTLWYANHNIDTKQPALAELSVKLKSTGHKLEDWNQETVLNAHQFWNEIRRLDQIDPESSSKTTWVYNYDPDWCRPEEDSSRTR